MADALPVVFFAVSNIPAIFRSADLRNYFSQFIESGGFQCFHYRHRPEVLWGSEGPPDPHVARGSEDLPEPPVPDTRLESGPPEPSINDPGSQSPENTENSSVSKKSVKSCCCIVSVFSKHADRFVKMFGGNLWIDSTGSWLSGRCVIKRVKVSLETDVDSFPYKTKHEQRHRVSLSDRFTQGDLKGLPELNPPSLMQNGNVGTTVKVFLQLIQACRLPPRLIRKLGLTFPKTSSNRRYGNVPFEYYNTYTVEASEDSIFTAAGHEIAGPSGVNRTTAKLRQPRGHTETKETEIHQDDEEDEEDELSNVDDDDDRCEEWERHEALHEDVTSQERSKERLFEEEIELKWEKGGSGLVFYTDAQYWQEEEGDFDEQTTDNWDVDMSVYYDKDGGDMDARDFVRMRYDKRMRDGLENRSGHTQPIGSFERFTKGFGRRVMEKQGWKDGEGLGTSRPGIPDALESDGQHPNCKRGFGYHGEKLTLNTGKKPRINYHISTVYDEPKDVDKPEPLLRRLPTTNIKYREWQPGGTIGPRR
ncbi:G patch domain-containing protein 3 [Gadus chalcogrammus]|uniref:G patch domain-containing protein 3 n=1 Tax=Gadus chalcogrammus TaxID=1042646 RepID=UPI0024C43F21|nr:G patch domain-containing protein 3 [Gadus chalcogrammus]